MICNYCNNEHSSEDSYYCNNGHDICIKCIKEHAHKNKMKIAKFILKLKLKDETITQKHYESLILYYTTILVGIITYILNFVQLVIVQIQSI